MAKWLSQSGILVLTAVMLVGIGCESPTVSDLSPEKATESLSLLVGDEIVMRPTILGLGGGLVDWFGGDSNDRVVTIDEWVAGDQVAASWSITTEVATETSADERKTYDE